MTLQRGSRPRHGRRAIGALVAFLAACSSPTVIVFPPLEVVVATGDGQYGTVGQTLATPLQVIVRTISGRLSQKGVSVFWEIEQGDASLVDIATTVTDTTGSARMRVRLGSSIGPVTVRATVQSERRPVAIFELFTVDRPELDGLFPTTASPGTTITLTGNNFSPDADQNVVLFSGVRGRVSDASATELSVEVPLCLPARGVAVSVQLGVVASDTTPLSVGPGGEVASLEVGDFIDVADDEGFTCLGLPGAGAEYLTIVYSASTVGAATHPYRLTALSSLAPNEATEGPDLAAAVAATTGNGLLDAQGAWDLTLRELEADLAGNRSARLQPQRTPPLAPATVVPTLGERRTFSVFAGGGEFTEITAVAQLVSDRAVLFVDENHPAGGYGQADLQGFADRFDDVIHPAVTDAFGATSDLDDNDRVVILFTPAVNALTPRGAAGFIAGFFFGLDLLPEMVGSNKGEIFYTLVPDPDGEFSDPRSTDALLNVTPAILAHEFQHMVHFNERVLQLGAESTEAVWLSEGLAQFAEEIVALEYQEVGDATSAALFRAGTRQRARRYLVGTDTVSLIIATGQGSLAERGAGFLFVMYLEDQVGGDLLRRLTRTTRTGVESVEAELGREWAHLLADWWEALYFDGPGPETGRRVYPSVDLRAFLGNPFPLVPVAVGAGDFTQSGSLWSSSAGYYIVVPPVGGSTTLRLGGEAGGVSSREADLRMRVIRIS